MGDDIGHECGFAMVRLLKPPQYYLDKYGTHFFGLNRMYMLMEKQRHRGQDGAGVASVTLDVPPGSQYIHCEKSIASDSIKDLFGRVQLKAAEKAGKAPKIEGKNGVSIADPNWVREHVPFCGEAYLGHVRYGTDSENSIDKCHPVTRESNWLTRNLVLAANFNITNNEDLFASLVQLGQHPRQLSDTVMLLEKVGHFVDKENNDLFVKYSASGHDPQTSFSLIAENMNVARILRRAAADWDGGYAIAGLLGHGDAFVLRDPSGIRPAFFFADEELIAVASEAPLIQSVFGVKEETVHPIPPGQALVIRRSGAWTLERILEPLPFKQCSFERIYFSRGNDARIYREREHMGRLLLRPLIKVLDELGVTLQETVLSFIPNTSELAFNGLAKEAQAYLDGERDKLFKELSVSGAGAASEEQMKKFDQIMSAKVRVEKVIHKDAKVRTFIQEASSREHLTLHAYDVHYGTIRRGLDSVVAFDDSIVRGNTLRNAILRTVDRLGPTNIIVISSCPQIRYPDVYGIDMAKLGDLAAFKAAITLLQERGKEGIIREVYTACRTQLSKPITSRSFVNHVKRIYDMFTPEEISAKIVEQITPNDCKAEVGILFNTVDALHKAMPEYAGDWYFTGEYPTPGGTKVCCRAFVLWYEGSSARCYGVSSAASTVMTSVLVIGHGGAEHALAWKLSQSHDVGCVYVAPGNGGVAHAAHHHGQNFAATGDDAEGYSGHSHAAPLVPVDVPLTPPHFKEVKDFCKERHIALAVVGQETLLREGLADELRGAGVPTFGPSRAAAEIESSQQFSKSFLERCGVPMAAAPPQESTAAEPEVSVLAFSDGTRFMLLPAAVQDQKRANDDERGPVTEGMGAFAPSSAVDKDVLQRIQAEIVQPIFDRLQKEERPFVGCLHVELVITADGAKLIALRSCMGDPVAQAALPLLDANLFEVLANCAGGRLREDAALAVRPNLSVVAVVMASAGYPNTPAGSYRRNAITGLERALCVPGAHVFHTGTTVEETTVDSSNSGRRRSMSLQRGLSTSLTPGGYVPMLAHRVSTSGGRVLTVAAVARSLHEARERAYVGVRAINFEDAWYRHDIAALASTYPAGMLGRTGSGDSMEKVPVSPTSTMAGPETCEFTYRAAGVDSAACDAALKSFEPLLRKTWAGDEDTSTPVGVRGKTCQIGATADGWTLVSGANALGTKLKIACTVGDFSTLGIDVVALCVNDIAARGAKPLFFHEHFSIEKLDAHQAIQLVTSVSDGCLEAGCKFLEAGMAELPGVFAGTGFDFVGFGVGIAEKGSLLPRMEDMAEGDFVIGLPASGLHSNGYSLVRAVIRAAGLQYSQAAPFDPTRSLGEALLPATRIYVKSVLALARAGLIKGAAQVAQGGLEHCLDSTLPRHLQAQLRADTWELPAELRWLAAVGKVPLAEISSTFNCGLGMVFVVGADKKDEAMKLLGELHEEPAIVGKLQTCPPSRGSAKVVVDGAQAAWLMLPELGVSLPFPQVLSSLQDPSTVSRRRVLVVAGDEDITPIPALLRVTQLPASAGFVVGVAAVRPDVKAMEIAKSARLKAITLGDGALASTDFFCEGLDEAPAEAGAGGEDGAGATSFSGDFCTALEKAMADLQAEMVVLLDDVDPSNLTRPFLQRHMGKVLIAHASLLPAFAQRSPIPAALKAGVCITGCTISFAVPQGSGGSFFGPQVLQEHVRIATADTATSLRRRLVEQCLAPVLPRAVQLVASGSVALRQDEEGFGLGRSASFTEAASEGLLHTNQGDAAMKTQNTGR
mmetsp:Transcript_102720/g.296944  ORF Transcript_102720/g.296944 Transcript_102720/m.296944 type:complete len:1772 (-) Transcript_102720:74-5389(-)